MSSDSTSINDLPTDPVGGGTIGGGINGGGINGGGISLQVNESIPQQIPKMSLDQQTISQIVSGLQQASVTGATQLPSRDIPQTIENITHDPQIQPTYIPQTEQKDYIHEYEESNEDIIASYNKNLKNNDSLDELYEEIQTPLFISLLYFLFQLPIFKKYLYKFFPALFSGDGNINIYGLLFMSALFGMLFYLLSKIMTSYNKF